MKLFNKLCFILLLSGAVIGQTNKVTELPDISVLGQYEARYSESEKSFKINEIEFAFQHYLYPSIKADFFTALHKNEEGHFKYELEEGYLTFSNLLDILLPNSKSNIGIGAIVGKKFLNLGKINQLHPEQLNFADRSIVSKQFFGSHHNLAGEGGSINYLLPLSFFSQIELGAYQAIAEEEEEGEAHANVEYENKIFTGRLWNSFELNSKNELELGLNYVLGNATATESDDQQQLMGIDLTLLQELGHEKHLKFQTELYQATYGDEGESREEQSGYFASLIYKHNSYLQAGLRYATLGTHGDEGTEINELALSLTRQLTETTKFRVQYTTGEHIEDSVSVKLLFGMGPHSHILQ